MAEEKSAQGPTKGRKCALAMAGLLGGYLFAQVLINIYELARPPEHQIYWVVEDAGRTVHFDPVLGNRLTEIPEREALMTRGRVVFLGAVRGNSQGLQTRFDFGPERTLPGAKRIAVFGDSYTAGAGAEWSWPDRIEQAARDSGEPMELLNFSIDGWGLANWAQVVTRMLAPQNYQLDGMVFAVWRDDLERRFYFADERGFDLGAIGLAASWDPETYPRTLEEARARMHTSPIVHILSPEQFDRALRGEWMPPVRRKFRWHLTMGLAGRALGWLRTAPQNLRPAGFEPERERLVQDIRRYIEARHIPVMVVYLPTADTAAGAPHPRRQFEEIKLFAAELGAKFVDGREPYAGLTPEEVRAEWRILDHHWNQAGSDRFAAYMHKVLREWVASGEFAGPHSQAAAR